MGLLCGTWCAADFCLTRVVGFGLWGVGCLILRFDLDCVGFGDAYGFWSEWRVDII